jgi:NAD-dependent SIR2 family protein deacetylase
MKKVFIFGAGSSADFGLPLANHIFSHADMVLRWKGQNQSLNLKNAIDNTEKHLRTLFTNIPKNKKKYPAFEQILTLIWNNGPFTNGWISQDVFSDFVNLLGLTIAGSMGFAHYKKKFYTIKPKYKQFIKTLIDGKDEVIFVSLNYDILLDSIIMDLNKHEQLDYGVPLTNITNRKFCKPGKGLLLKPHGSLNLSYCVQCDNVLCSEDNVFNSITNSSKRMLCPTCQSSDIRPIIIPPIYNKSNFIASCKQPFVNTKKSESFKIRSNCDAIQLYCTYVNYALASHLADADEITIIGYSLPVYDFDFKYILLNGLSRNKNRLKVKINLIIKETNKSNNEIIEPYRNLAGPVTIKHKFGFYNYLCGRS